MVIVGESLTAGGGTAKGGKIRVMAEDGATVTATQDSKSFIGTSTDGSVTLTVDSDGEWTVTAKKDGKSLVPPSLTFTLPQEITVYKISTTLNDNSWAAISAVSKENGGASYWSVGDCKSVALNGTAGGVVFNTTLWVYIIGFNHNASTEGAGIAFQGFKTAQTNGVDVCLDAMYGYTAKGFYMSTSTGNVGGWEGSYANNIIMPQIKALLPSDLRSVIRTTFLCTDNVGGGNNLRSNVTGMISTVYLLSEYEVFGSISKANSYESNVQKQYSYYANGNSKIKYLSNNTSTAGYWWLRSPYRTTDMSFCCVNDSGSVDTYYSNYSFGIAPAFKV